MNLPDGTIPLPHLPGRTWLVVDLPVMAYAEAWRLQARLVEARHTASIASNILLLLEHPPVFTLGRRGGRDNLKVSEGFLEATGIPIFHIERGGDITFHGPGQLVGYGIIDLPAAGMSVTDYVKGLEEIMIRAAACWGVTAERNPKNRGVWVGNRKLGSIGVAVRRGITFHGFAFNVNLCLEPFSWINPCGLKGVEMTSLERELTRSLPIEEVRETLKRNTESVFKIDLRPVDLATVEALL
jgi:lipoyl(octanoyl) transferase